MRQNRPLLLRLRFGNLSLLDMRTGLPCHIPDRWSRGANWIWPDLAFVFVHERSGNEINTKKEWTGFPPLTSQTNLPTATQTESVNLALFE